jgi:hypothetical protein
VSKSTLLVHATCLEACTAERPRAPIRGTAVRPQTGHRSASQSVVVAHRGPGQANCLPYGSDRHGALSDVR